MRRIVAVLALAVGAVVVGVVTAPTADAAGEVLDLGWWTRLPTTTAPEGGFAVGRAPDGATSVAAVRVDLGPGVTSLELAAPESGGSVDTAVIRACLASEAWEPAHGGAFADRPDIDCGISAAFQRDAAGTWRADVSALVVGRSGPLSIGIVADPPSGDDPVSAAPVEVQFGAPTTTATAPPPSATVTTAPRPVTTSPSTSGGSGFGSGSSPLTIPPSTPRAGSTTDTTLFDFPEPTTTTTIPIVEERAMGSVTDAGVIEGDGRPVREAFFLIFLAAVVGVGVALASRFAESRV